ncbi:MAG: hypothetical protein OXC19_26230 [Bryobacterales bacterium]|nr:hypothetical protein [Bryobacterales bacterium]
MNYRLPTEVDWEYLAGAGPSGDRYELEGWAQQQLQPGTVDRCPEVDCYRRKLHELAADTAAVRTWQTAQASAWSAADRDALTTLCLDGHVKTYAGGGRLAPRFVPRQKLCLLAATSYWLNALGGNPFLCWHKPTDPGIVQAVREDVLPALRRAEGRHLDSAVQELVWERKSIPSHVRAAGPGPEDRIETLPEAERLLRDTLLMLVYRAETAMLPSLQIGSHPVPDPRAVLKALFTSDACLLPDPAAGTLTVRLHHPTTWGRERQLELVLADLNASRTRYPDTNLWLEYEFAG